MSEQLLSLVPRLKSRTAFPPFDFQAIIPGVGQKEPFKGSFSEVVEMVWRFRKANPHLCQKNGWSLDRAIIAGEVDEENAARCLAHGWVGFVEIADNPFIEASPEVKKKGWLGSVAAGGRALASGLGVWKDMFGEEGTIEREQAESRALVCVGCPENDTSGTLLNWFTSALAEQIGSVYRMLRDLDLKTTQDERLGVCRACRCPMKAKVHAKLSHINRHMPAEVKAKLHPANPVCWVLEESLK